MIAFENKIGEIQIFHFIAAFFKMWIFESHSQLVKYCWFGFPDSPTVSSLPLKVQYELKEFGMRLKITI